MAKGGIDFWSTDACHSRHDILKGSGQDGMQWLFVVGREGQNHNVIAGVGLDLSESSVSYEKAAAALDGAGFGALISQDPGPFKRKPVIFADGFKGTTAFSGKFANLHEALCGVHLPKAARRKLRYADPHAPSLYCIPLCSCSVLIFSPLPSSQRAYTVVIACQERQDDGQQS